MSDNRFNPIIAIMFAVVFLAVYLLLSLGGAL